MCGICGVLGGERRQAEECVRGMMNALVHRGPDEEGLLVRSGAILGVRRLSVIDLSGGHQPIYNEAGDVGVVFNGEIYNFPRLRSELENRGHRFRTYADTEAIVHAYEEWGDRCVERLHGMFAFAVWDGRRAGPNSATRGRVLVARDRLGIKPLYYTVKAGALLFASEVRALLASNVVERCVCLEALNGYLQFGSVCEPLTLVEGVYSLPPGHFLAFELDAPIVPEPKPYWDLSASAAHRGGQAPKTLASAGREVRSLLENSVSEQLLADVPIGVFLSGGLDSTALAALAVRQQRGIQTFTLSFREEKFNESEIAQRTARALGTDHHELPLSGDQVQSRLLEAVGALDQPSTDGINTFFVSWGARQAGLKVALSGLGGDELFGGYPSFRTTPQLSKLLTIGAWLPRQVREATSETLLAIGRRGNDPLRADRLRKVAAAFSRPEEFSHPYFLSRALFTPQQIERLFFSSAADRERARSEGLFFGQWLGQLVRKAEALRGQSAISYLELRTYMLNTLLRDTDSVSMHHSLEIRVPLLDDELVEFVVSLPDRAKSRQGASKALLAEAVKDLVPEEILRGRKRAFTLPWEHWLRGSLGKDVETRLGSLTPSLASVLNGEAVRSIWRQFLGGHTGWARPWSLFVLNEWVRTHIDEAECSAGRSSASVEAAAI